jgi:DNA-binding LacI/PurR family transcriptional regulator
MKPPPQPNLRSATIYDVARLAGVSHQTVSRYMRGYEGIRPKTRERVREAIETLDYRPNSAARSLNAGKSHRLVVLTQEITQIGPGKILEGANIAAREAGYVLDAISLDVSDEAAVRESIEIAIQHDLAGVVGLASTDVMNSVFGATKFRVPSYISLLDDEAEHPKVNRHGLLDAMTHLHELGHRDVMHVAGSPVWVAARNRVAEYQAAAKTLGMNSRMVVDGDWSAMSGYRAIKSMPGKLEATAILAANDQTALGIILALREAGYRVPEDVSVTGIDDNPESAFYSPPLTTVRLDFHNEGRHAVNQVLALINGEDPPPSEIREPELVIRESTAVANPRR